MGVLGWRGCEGEEGNGGMWRRNVTSEKSEREDV